MTKQEIVTRIAKQTGMEKTIVMTRLYDSFKDDEKPEWLTMDKIIEYSKEMIPFKE